jgi:hypothetical protein
VSNYSLILNCFIIQDVIHLPGYAQADPEDKVGGYISKNAIL